ncbi:MAG: hypothetical protein DSY80_03540 [Desulfocapsa sp.]|nr:MAG: hypothetical protein DSY80_03540 [Desulfocapsa sp.]
MIQSFLDDYGNILTWLGLLSIFCFFASLALIPVIIGRLPEDYFFKLFHHGNDKQSHLLRLLRYLLGVLLFAAGILMLFLPGQGLLTMILGLSLLDFPGKQQLVENLLRRETIRNTLNWIRNKRNTAPFLFPDKKQ